MKKPLTRTIAGRTFVINVVTEANDDPEIGETVSLAEVERAELEMAGELVGDAISAEAFAWMRKALSLRGVDLAALLDVRPETVSRWERGELDVPRSAWLVLGSMVLERLGRPTETQARAKRLVEPKQPGATV